MAKNPGINRPDWYVANEDHLTEPDGSRKTNGYEPEEPLPAQIFNWLWYSASLWIKYLSDMVLPVVQDVTGAITLGFEDDGKILRLDSTSAAFNIQLPDPSSHQGVTWILKDVGGTLSTNAVTLVRDASEDIEGVPSDYPLEADYGVWKLYCDGTDFYFL